MTSIALGSVLFQVLFIVAPLGATIVVGALTRGRARAFGLAGFGLLVADGVLGLGWVFVFPQIAGNSSVSLALLSGGFSAVRGLVTLVSIALLLFAVVVDRSRGPQAV